MRIKFVFPAAARMTVAPSRPEPTSPATGFPSQSAIYDRDDWQFFRNGRQASLTGALTPSFRHDPARSWAARSTAIGPAAWSRGASLGAPSLRMATA